MGTTSAIVSRSLGSVVPIILGLLLDSTGLARAQETSASIIGQVRDESGAVLPGVTVTVTSPALQLPQITTVTNAQGEYRVSPLPIGSFTVLYELGGFQSARQEEVRLTVGFAARLDVVLKVGTLAETVTVSGASPVVDVTATATITQLTQEQLQLIPTSRSSYVSVLAQAPGTRSNLDVGGSQMVENPVFRALGQLGEAWETLEGVVTSSAKNSQSGNFIDFASIDEARIVTVGGDAEAVTRGVQVVAIVKSGGNAFHGGARWNQTSGRFQSNNLDAALAARGITGGGKTEARWNIDTDLGGRVIQNRLWFYGGADQLLSRDQVAGVFKPDGTPATQGPHEIYFNGKISYQMSTSNRFIYFQQFGDMITRGIASQVTALNGWESRAEQNWHNQTIKGEWQGVRSSLVASVQYGFRIWDPYFMGVGDVPGTTDTATQVNMGKNWTFDGERSVEYNRHTTGSVTWYRAGVLGGNHKLKTGFDYVDTTHSRKRRSRGAAGDYRLVFQNGVPFGIDTLNVPATGYSNPQNPDHYLGAYVKDDWVVGRRLTFNLGLRYTHDRGFLPPQCREAGPFAVAECYPQVDFNVWNSVAPRIGVAWDVTGDGKTAVKAGWGRFDHKRDIDPEITSANKYVTVATNWRWRDLNGNRLYDPGEVNLNPQGPDFLGLSSVGTSSGSADAVPNPDEKQPKQDQFMVAVERQVIPNLAVRFTGVYARGFNNYRLQNNLRPYSVYTIPITRPDPGPDGRVGTSDDTGKSFTYYEYPTSLVGRQFQQGMLINDPNYAKEYKTLEVAGFKRLSRGWQFSTSYSATKVDEFIAAATVPTFDPNAEINAGAHLWEFVGKVSGGYVLPADVMVSSNFQHLSGANYARNVLFTGGVTIPSISLNVEPLRRLPSIDLLDLRVEKRVTLSGGKRLAVRVDLFNALNGNTVTGMIVRSGATFGRPTAIMPARIVVFGAGFEF